MIASLLKDNSAEFSATQSYNARTFLNKQQTKFCVKKTFYDVYDKSYTTQKSKAMILC